MSQDPSHRHLIRVQDRQNEMFWQAIYCWQTRLATDVETAIAMFEGYYLIPLPNDGSMMILR